MTGNDARPMGGVDVCVMADLHDGNDPLEAAVRLPLVPRQGDSIEVEHPSGTDYLRVCDVVLSPAHGVPTIWVQLDGYDRDDLISMMSALRSGYAVGRDTGHEALLTQPLKIVWGDFATTDQERNADFLLSDDGRILKDRPGRSGATFVVERGELCRLAIGDVLALPGVLEDLGLKADAKIILERTPPRSEEGATS